MSPRDIYPAYENPSTQIIQPKIKYESNEEYSELIYDNIWSDGLCGCGSDVRIELFILKVFIDLIVIL